MKIGKYTIIGAIFDLVDWIGIGMIPVFGDVLDVAATIFWFVSGVGLVGAASLIEVVPLADILPTNIVVGLYADNKIKAGKKS
jgi:hypothetical protein